MRVADFTFELPDSLIARHPLAERRNSRLLTLDGFPHRGQPICLTEFGGVALVPDTQDYRDKTWGYSRARTEDDFAQMVCGVIEAARTTGMFSGFCYTQFADTFQEANGLLYADRTPKIPLEKIAAAVRGPVVGR